MNEIIDLIVVGAGPTGIAIGAEARRQGLSVLLIDKGPLTAAIQGYPTFMEFFTTRDRLEIANVPFSIPDVKPTRRQVRWNNDRTCSANTPSPRIRDRKRGSFSLPPRISRTRPRTRSFLSG